MYIPASLQATAATVITRTVGTVARLIDHRDEPDKMRPLLRREALLMTATGVLTYAVHELFDKIIIPEVSKSSLLARNQTLWRAILSLPGLVVIEALSRLFFQEDHPQSCHTLDKAPEPSQLHARFIQYCQDGLDRRREGHLQPQSASPQTARTFIA